MTTPRRSRAMLLAGACLLSSLAWLPGTGGLARERPLPAFDKLQRGMTPEQVREQVGSPKRIARQVLYHRHIEQWIYDAPVAARLRFDCPRGQKPRLITNPKR